MILNWVKVMGMKHEPNHTKPENDLLGDDPNTRTTSEAMNHALIYGTRQTVFCVGTDLAEPYINQWFQNKVGDKEHHVTSLQTYVGEFAGDGAALGAYVALKTFCAKPINMMIGGVKNIASPLLERMGRKSIDRWAGEHHVKEDDPRYQQRVENYKTYQAENIVDSAIIAGTATGFNLLTQRHLMGNKQTYWTMLQGKWGGTALTLGGMSLFNVLFPRATKKLENTIEKKFVDPVMQVFSKELSPEEMPIAAHPEAQADIPYSLAPEKRDGLVYMTGHHFEKLDLDDAQAVAKSVAGQRKVYEALLASFEPEGYMLSVMGREYLETIEKQHPNCEHDAAARLTLHEVSRARVQMDAAEKRKDLQAFIALLDDPAFIEEVKHKTKSGKLPAIENTKISEAEKNTLSGTLMQASTAKDREAAIFDKAEAQQLQYEALAHAYKPDGPAARLMASRLKELVPNEDPADLEGIARDYMEYYQKEALNMAGSFRVDSEVVQQAVERAHQLQQKYHSPEASLTLAS